MPREGSRDYKVERRSMLSWEFSRRQYGCLAHPPVVGVEFMPKTQRRQMATYPHLLNTQPYCPQNLGQGQTAWEGSQEGLQFGD